MSRVINYMGKPYHPAFTLLLLKFAITTVLPNGSLQHHIGANSVGASGTDVKIVGVEYL